MSEHWDDPETIRKRIWREIIVQEYTDTDALGYIRAAKEGDDG